MALRSLIAALLLAIASPALPQTDTAVPADPIARAKFPKTDPYIIDKLAVLNKVINHAITQATDEEHYGVAEKFVTWPEDGKGDCEDYALTKIEAMGNLGWPLVGKVRLDTVVVRFRDGTADGHAVAEYRLPSGEVMILDSNNDEPMTRRELERQGYVFFDWTA